MSTVPVVHRHVCQGARALRRSARARPWRCCPSCDERHRLRRRLHGGGAKPRRRHVPRPASGGVDVAARRRRRLDRRDHAAGGQRRRHRRAEAGRPRDRPDVPAVLARSSSRSRRPARACSCASSRSTTSRACSRRRPAPQGRGRARSSSPRRSSLRFTNAAGTDVTYRLGAYPVMTRVRLHRHSRAAGTTGRPASCSAAARTTASTGRS